MLHNNEKWNVRQGKAIWEKQPDLTIWEKHPFQNGTGVVMHHCLHTYAFLYMPDVLCVLSHRPVGGEGSSGGDILETLPPKAQPILIVPIGSELGVQVAGKVLE